MINDIMTLRPFTINDAPIILSWIKDLTAFRKWSADRYPTYPPRPEDMVAQYAADNIFPFTAIDDKGKVVGHIMLRYPDSSKTVIRLGFVIVAFTSTLIIYLYLFKSLSISFLSFTIKS